MLALLVPDGCYRDESRRHGSFGQSQEESHRGKAAEAVWCRQAHAHNAPEKHSDTDKLRNRQSRHEVDEGVLGHKVSKVEDGRAPGVLVGRQVKIRDESKDLFKSGTED
jgi:hypothetical protein